MAEALHGRPSGDDRSQPREPLLCFPNEAPRPRSRLRSTCADLCRRVLGGIAGTLREMGKAHALQQEVEIWAAERRARAIPILGRLVPPDRSLEERLAALRADETPHREAAQPCGAEPPTLRKSA